MNKKQMLAADRLEKALNHCGKVGFTGGVFEDRFCLWDSKKTDPYVNESYDFFTIIEEEGIMLFTSEIILDGGAGN